MMAISIIHVILISTIHLLLPHGQLFEVNDHGVSSGGRIVCKLLIPFVFRTLASDVTFAPTDEAGNLSAAVRDVLFRRALFRDVSKSSALVTLRLGTRSDGEGMKAVPIHICILYYYHTKYYWPITIVEQILREIRTCNRSGGVLVLGNSSKSVPKCKDRPSLWR